MVSLPSCEQKRRSRQIRGKIQFCIQPLCILCFAYPGKEHKAWQKQSWTWNACTHITHSQAPMCECIGWKLREDVGWMCRSWEHLCVSAVSSHSVCNERGRRRAFSLFQSVDMWGLFFTVPSKSRVTHPHLYTIWLLQEARQRCWTKWKPLWSITCTYLDLLSKSSLMTVGSNPYLPCVLYFFLFFCFMLLHYH